MAESASLCDIRFDWFRESDIATFLAHAGDEGWICDRWEFDLLLRTFPSGCLTARIGGAVAGYVTSIAYGTSSWIGNLLVLPDARGKGIGRALMELVLETLEGSGVHTVWLTASAAGQPIYEKLGFRTVDTVQRWVGVGTGGPSRSEQSPSRAMVEAADAAGWGSRRGLLLHELFGKGNLMVDGGSFLITQPCGGGIQVGPWGGGGADEAARLLTEARCLAGAGTRMFLDSPRRNGTAVTLLSAQSFGIQGSTLLMRRGPDPGYRPERVFALGSMGSMG
jgi:GNAT superfamily N-acetyltransferase